MTLSLSSPRQRRLIRVADLAGFRDALSTLALEGDPIAARRRVFVLPSHASIELLRRTIEERELAAGRAAIVLPDMLTRDELIARLHGCMDDAPPMLSRVEREVIVERAARLARETAAPPFHVRPGLVAAILDFYDDLRRRGRTVRRFAEVMNEELGGEAVSDDTDDRGTAELARQAEFLRYTFEEYERAVEAIGAIDEHGIRARVVDHASALTFDHLVIGVADHPSDPRGLWPADLDVLGRLQPLHRLDVIVTSEAHDAGFRERIERELPEIDVVTWERRVTPPPLVIVPTAPSTSRCHISRDREEELRDVARMIRLRSREAGAAPADRTAIVYQRPLPYVYLAHAVLGDARVLYQVFDTLPLAAEPYAALVDIVLSFARTGGTRELATALLRSPLMRFEIEGQGVGLRDAAALDAVLIEQRATGEAASYVEAVAQFAGGKKTRNGVEVARARRAAVAVATAQRGLQAFLDAPAASQQVEALSRFIRAHERLPRHGDEWRERTLRARGAALGALDAMAEAYRRHDDVARDDDALAAAIHHWIERQTFAPRQGATGVQLVDAVAARFGEFDHVHVVGLVDADWPERPARNMFFTSGVLKELGWPSEPDHLRAQQAAFRDLVRLPAGTLMLSAFQLEGDAVVSPSPMAVEANSLTPITMPLPETRVFVDEVMGVDPLVTDGLTSDQAAWLALRRDRGSMREGAYRGDVGPREPRAYPVSHVDRYVQCPFKYFAAYVLQLGEEAEEESGLTARERGTLLHRLFERFYAEWDGDKRGAITPATLQEAVTRFERLAAAGLAHLAPSDRLLEEARLIGSAVGRGVAERVFQIECDAGHGVTRRLLEESLNSEFDFPATGFGAPQRISIRGKADRIDVLDDGSLRVIDYKLTAAPKNKNAVQLPDVRFLRAESD